MVNNMLTAWRIYFNQLKKAVRYISIYGFTRTLFKIAGRRHWWLPGIHKRGGEAKISVIGCGQFAFATLGYFLRFQKFGIVSCYDINKKAQNAFQKAYNVKFAPSNIDELFNDKRVETVYIASNHASHTPYAIMSLGQNIDTYIEKPIAVNRVQLDALVAAIGRTKAQVFVGYNRPFSQAIQDLRTLININQKSGVTLQCFIVGHAIPKDNWYRNPEEGSRVCGNLGHWIDLFIHIIGWRSYPEMLSIRITTADALCPDDNLCVAIASDKQDLFSLVFSTRSEPFEGVNETINFQHEDTICKIDDFRFMKVWCADKIIERRYWPKDVGHKNAILQPFRKENHRSITEVILSTKLMLHISEMLTAGKDCSDFEIGKM